jgi:MFS family permease
VAAEHCLERHRPDERAAAAARAGGGRQPAALSAGDGTGAVDTLGAGGLRQAFAALRSRAYLRFWLGAIVASSGTWMQNVTVPFLLYQSTGRATWAGLGAFCQFFPSMLASPLGGVVADRYPRRLVLAACQAVALTVALALWVTVRLDLAEPAVLLGLVAVAGAANGIQTPSWQALLPQLVPRAQVLNAVALNAMQANAARAFGPTVAGLVLARYGAGTAFLINAVAYLALPIALATIRPRPTGVPGTDRDADQESALDRLAAGVRYTGGHTGLLLAITLTGLVSFVGTPVVQLAPVFAREVFRVGPSGYGVLAASLGVGAVLGSILLSAYGGRLCRSTVAAIAVGACGASALALAAAPTLALAAAAIVLLGVGYLVVLSTANTAIQLLAGARLRGRVLSLSWMAFAGAYPLGAVAQGWSTDLLGVRATVAIFGGLLLAALLMVGWQGRLRALDRHVHQAGYRPATALS